MTYPLATWNVNGLRACIKNGFLDWFRQRRPYALALQEVRATWDQLPNDFTSLLKEGFHYEHFEAEKKGYSGTGILSSEKPLKVWKGIGKKEFDCEGRVLTVEFKDFFLCSAYFPNSRDQGARIQYKIAFCDQIVEFLSQFLNSSKVVILAGDYNIAHREIDLARPQENQQTAGFLPEERAWMEKFLNSGWLDCFRFLHPQKVQYSWWSARTRARERNIGWRIDYLNIPENQKERLKAAWIEDETRGSDHCPVWIEIL